MGLIWDLIKFKFNADSPHARNSKENTNKIGRTHKQNRENTQTE
jgi:hypothetical protein